jgi:hypothetical protein
MSQGQPSIHGDVGILSVRPGFDLGREQSMETSEGHPPRWDRLKNRKFRDGISATK